MADQGKGSEQSTSAESEHAKAVEFKNSGNHRYSKNDFKRAIADYKKVNDASRSRPMQE
ncbi:hypothetical protein J6590_048068 [Homalodisca vitripennis]|nr:hypothetical protein J6590_048068 [Homalodisca vitripennis]